MKLCEFIDGDPREILFGELTADVAIDFLRQAARRPHLVYQEPEPRPQEGQQRIPGVMEHPTARKKPAKKRQ